MKRVILGSIFVVTWLWACPQNGTAALRENVGNENLSEMEGEQQELQEALDEMETYSPIDDQSPQRTRNLDKPIRSGNEGFLAGPNWEFDGFVVGGQEQDVRSMFVVNDLIYLNVGHAQGFEPGDRLNFYKRGSKVRDPESGQFLGYEVQQIGVGEITNRIEEGTCSVRVVSSNDGIRIGDLVQRQK